jgi:hypothetical protein
LTFYFLMTGTLPMILLAMVKRAVYYALASGPFLLLGMIVINSRLRVNDWQFVEYGSETSSRIHAYAGPVSQVRQRIAYGKSYTADDLRSVIALWLDAYARGDLQDVQPATTIEYGMTPVYQQILDAKQILVSAAIRQGDQLRSEGEHGEAAEFYVSAAELANVGKYSEFLSITEGAIYQIASIERLVAISPELDAAKCAEIAARIDLLDDDTARTLAHTTSRAAAIYQADLNRRGERASILEAARESGAMVTAEGDPVVGRIELWRATGLSDGTRMPLFGRSRMALLHERQYAETLEAALGVLSNEGAMDASSN